MLRLYTTQGCHLCEQAMALIQAEYPNIQVAQIEIGDNNDLVEKYGIRIPVLSRADKRELDWPFSTEELIKFLETK